MDCEYFDIFNVYKSNTKNYVFVPKCLIDEPLDVSVFLEYFFGYNTCLSHFICQFRKISFLSQNESKVKARLFNSLKVFLTEASLYEKNNDKVKAGMFGDHCLSIILEKYFNADCIINKCTDLKTSPSVAVFGTDVDYYSKAKNAFFFGEAKFTDSLELGIGLIKSDLSGYEKRIKDEYTYVLNRCSDDSTASLFGVDLNEIMESSYDIQEVIKRSKMDSIYIPLFIMHGGKYDASEILEKIDRLGGMTFLGVKTFFYVISLPVKDKKQIYDSLELYISQRIEDLKKERDQT